MKLSDLEHLIRAAGAIADDTDIVVIGSQSILGQFPNAPAKVWFDQSELRGADAWDQKTQRPTP